jgi:hypothetical protein
MAKVIQSIFIDPPIAIARVGGSTVPQDAFVWVQSPDPRADGETSIAPTWSLNVLSDGSIEPVLPTEIRFRDGPLIRPVCPFFELWALVGEQGSDPASWTEVALTPALLAQQGADVSNITVRIEAHNLKAARRTTNPRHGFGTHPAVEIAGNHFQSVVLPGVSPPGAEPRMIPPGRNIPLGSVQVLRSRPNVAGAPGAGIVDVEIVRLRFSPARGRFYGPPQAAQATPFAAVDATNAFLDPDAGWFGAQSSAFVEPGDTYDGAESREARSLGVVDDTCEARITVSLALPGSARPLAASANVFSGPPDWGPDRRPFLSIADELNDRAADAPARNAAMTGAERNAWVEDLFERIYETVSLFNVDHYRAERGLELTGSRLRPTVIPGDHVPDQRQAMGGRDALRNPLIPVGAPSDNEPLPLSQHARTRHRALSDLQALRNFVSLSPGRIQTLVRQPFEVETGENGDLSTMRMPPFMRQSNAQPLTLSAWQYRLLMDWAAAAAIEAFRELAVAEPGLSDLAALRRAEVLAALDGPGGGNT